MIYEDYLHTEAAPLLAFTSEELLRTYPLLL